MTVTLTLQQIRDASPCGEGWIKLTKAVGTDLTTVIGIGDVLISNGHADALWCLRCMTPRDRVSIIMPAVKRASAHTKDQRVHDCIAALDRWLGGDDTVDLKAIISAVEAAARAAAMAAEARAEAAVEAAWAAAMAAMAAMAAEAGAEAAARAAARAAAEAEARAARAAARAAAEAAGERRLQTADIMRLSPPLILKGETK